MSHLKIYFSPLVLVAWPRRILYCISRRVFKDV